MSQVERSAVIEHVSWAPRFTLGMQPTLQGAEQGAALHKFPPDVDALFTMGTRMQRAAAVRGTTVGVLVLQVTDLPEVDLVFGRDAAERVVDFVMTELTHISARKGYAVRTSADTFALLMPEVSGRDIHRALQARLGQACALELEIRGHELLLVPDLMARTVSKTESVRAAFESVCRMLAAERRMNARGAEYARHERVVPTVPMPLAPVPDVAAANDYSFPATVRMGLAG
jgi:hypothetical protein